jgi:AAA domain/AAA domain, putative AbiEii toxin, Type IV TA system
VKLLKIRFGGFRRFAEPQGLDLNEDLIALVGPNEAGKSSVLDAIELLAQGKPPGAGDSTRSLGGVASIAGLFRLEESDHEAIAHVHGAGVVERAWMELRNDRETGVWTLEAPLTRDVSSRKASLGLVQSLIGDPALDILYSQNTESPWDPELVETVVETLGSAEETLDASGIQRLEELAGKLRDLNYPDELPDAKGESEESDAAQEAEVVARRRRREAREEAASTLDQQAAVERQPTPASQVVAALQERLPPVAVFRAADRELRSEYALDDVITVPSPALTNLCALADLDLGEVVTALDAGRGPHVEKLIEKANVNLKQGFQDTWGQSDVYPRFSPPNDRILRLYIATEGSEDYSHVDERSDGLRWFMALHAFLSAVHTKQPILLVDEAETHLHYDAQTDLIDALMRQRVAQMTVYTTHSIGCLPPDLGRGIRAILPERDAERSRIFNSYWSVEPNDRTRVGYAPLLFAMGAQMLPLTIPRFAVIAEGPSDALLLPSLLRAASGASALKYRVIPGLSELPLEAMARLTEEAGKVLFLVDGDDSGDTLQEQLTTAEINAALVFSLGELAAGCTLEDVVHGPVLASAINAELAAWGIGSAQLAAEDLPAAGRWAWLATWDGITPEEFTRLSKLRIAQRVVDIHREQGGGVGDLIEPGLVIGLRKLHGSFMKLLGLGDSD